MSDGEEDSYAKRNKQLGKAAAGSADVLAEQRRRNLALAKRRLEPLDRYNREKAAHERLFADKSRQSQRGTMDQSDISDDGVLRTVIKLTVTLISLKLKGLET